MVRAWVNLFFGDLLLTVFYHDFVQLIDEAKAAEYNLFEEYGETEETLPELEQLQNGAERLRNPYSRLSTLALAIAEAQPVAPHAMLNLLAQTLEDASATADAVEASTNESKRIWNLPCTTKKRYPMPKLGPVRLLTGGKPSAR
jgi:hypothetical protein